MKIDFDPFSPAFFEGPYDLYKAMRDEAPVYFSETYGFYALSRYEDVVAAHKDWATFSSSHGVDLSTLKADPETIGSSIIMMDPPAHDRFRALVSRVFTPKAIQSMEPVVRTIIKHYADQLDGRDKFDAITDLAAPFPVEIISEMLGVPEGDRQQIRHWIDIALTREIGDMHPTAAGAQAYVDLHRYFRELAVAKRSTHGDDLISRLIQATVDRGDGQMTSLDDLEIAGFASTLGGAGAETVTKLVGNAFVLFHRNPGQWQKVLDDPGRIPKAVEEVLRFYPPSQYQGRFSMKESSFRGETIPAGFPVLLLTGAATRDERFYPNPDVFDLDRDTGHALGFGLGIHSCLGAALARMESRVLLEELAKRWPQFEVDEAGLTCVSMSNVAGFSRVPVTVRR